MNDNTEVGCDPCGPCGSGAPVCWDNLNPEFRAYVEALEEAVESMRQTDENGRSLSAETHYHVLAKLDTAKENLK